MRLKTLATALCLSLAAPATVIAAPVDFSFSIATPSDSITGIIEGLDSDGLGQAATLITVFGFFDTYTFDSDDLDSGSFFPSNSFDVSGGVVAVSTSVNSLEVLGTTGAFFGQLLFSGTSGRLAELDIGGQPLSEFSSSVTFAPINAVPLPAGSLLLLTGLGGIAAFKRRKKCAA